jgi:hypothetical protein
MIVENQAQIRFAAGEASEVAVCRQNGVQRRAIAWLWKGTQDTKGHLGVY